MNSRMMAYVPGAKYEFRVKPDSHHAVVFGHVYTPSKYSDHAPKTLTYIRDARGNGVTHHLFSTKGGAMESFTDGQMTDYHVTKK